MDTSPASVLVIENHPIMREALCTAIACEADLAVAAQAANGAEALQMLETLKPDIILITLGNPVQDELEVLKSLRESLPATPILALTSNEVTGQEQAALDCGAQAVLTKAAPRRELIETLRSLKTKKIMDHSKPHREKEVVGKKAR